MTQNKPIVAVEGAELEGGEAGTPAAGEYRALGGSAVRGARGRCGGRGGERDDGKLLARETVAGVRTCS